ncbi:MAG: small glutamine-rich tetratricopeptide repeat-containing [Lasallia pustulata]|uniref:Small glutamine-rich tetratricopeptide repeat-containing n=1 Tax=Lasallia pustulata TaxID=136370 RepID=A0A5M8PDA1_9LECA|nr:MAG: small glutamine-rich tetratricopeptide repeat-containing [Lasallia pustulata]
MASTSDSKKRLALAIIDFLSTSLKDGTLTPEDTDSIEVAQSCIADTFHVDPSDKSAMQAALGGQSLLSIYSVYEKLKGKSTANTSGSSSATEARPSTPSAPPPTPTPPKPPPPKPSNSKAAATPPWRKRTTQPRSRSTAGR